MIKLSFCLLCFINGVFTEVLNSTTANNSKKKYKINRLQAKIVTFKFKDSA